MGSEYQMAAADKATKTTTICSVPYAIDDNASDDNNAKAANRVNLCSSFSADFKGLPTNNLLSNPISKLLYTIYFKFIVENLVNKML